MGQCVSRIQFDGSRKMLKASCEPRASTLVPEVSAEQVLAVRGGILGVASGESQAFIGRHWQHQRASDLGSNRTLNPEDARPRFVKRVRPKDMIIACADQLDREMDPIGCVAHAAHEQGVDAEFTCRDLRIFSSTGVLLHRLGRPDGEAANVIQS